MNLTQIEVLYVVRIVRVEHLAACPFGAFHAKDLAGRDCGVGGDEGMPSVATDMRVVAHLVSE